VAAASELNDGLDRLAPPNERTEKEGLGIGKDQGWCGALKSETVLDDKHGIGESVGVDESVLELVRPNVWS